MIRGASEEEAEMADAVVCCRVADLPPLESFMDPRLAAFAKTVRERSSEVPCSVCGEMVLVDSLSPKKPPRVCVNCVMAMETESKH